MSHRPPLESRAPREAGAWSSPPLHLLGGTQGSPQYVLPDGDSAGLLLDFLPRRVRNRSLTDLASSSSARFFFLSSSEMLMSGSRSFTRSMTCPAGSAEGRWVQGESQRILVPWLTGPATPHLSPEMLPGADLSSQTSTPCRAMERAAWGQTGLPQQSWPLQLIACDCGSSSVTNRHEAT